MSMLFDISSIFAASSASFSSSLLPSLVPAPPDAPSLDAAGAGAAPATPAALGAPAAPASAAAGAAPPFPFAAPFPFPSFSLASPSFAAFSFSSSFFTTFAAALASWYILTTCSVGWPSCVHHHHHHHNHHHQQQQQKQARAHRLGRVDVRAPDVLLLLPIRLAPIERLRNIPRAERLRGRLRDDRLCRAASMRRATTTTPARLRRLGHVDAADRVAQQLAKECARQLVRNGRALSSE